MSTSSDEYRSTGEAGRRVSGPPAGGGRSLGLPRADQARVLAALFEDEGEPGAPREPRTLGRFRIVGRLGQGAMGTVLEAHDPSLDRTVAIKILHGWAGDRHRGRLQREAHALARLSHPHVVQVFETGEADGEVFVVMELVRGRTLRQWQHEPHDWRACLEVYRQAGRGLAAAHAVGIVHRDFKPANCIIDDAGRVRVLDFGLARGLGDEGPEGTDRIAPGQAAVTAVDEPNLGASAPTGSDGRLDRPLTRTGTMLGTPAYMAPEQHQARSVDARADQFSFCVALYEALLGVRPFEIHVGSSALRGESPRFVPAPSHASQPAIPAWLRRVLLRGMALDDAARFPSMDELLSTIERQLRARRRRVAGLALGASLLAAVGTTWALAPAAVPSCELDRSALVGAWDDERRVAVREAFLASPLPFAATTHQAVEHELDGWADAWVDAQRGACEATHVQGIASGERLDRRTGCLDRRRRELGGVVSVLAQAGPEIVARAPDVLATLPSLHTCDDPPGSGEAARPTDPPAVAQALARAHGQLAEGRALAAAGRLVDAQALADEVERSATELGELSLELEARALRAVTRMNGGELEAGARLLLDAIGGAERARLDVLAAALRVELAVRVVGAWSKPELEAVLVEQAEAWAERMELDDALAHELALARIELEIGAGRLEPALVRVRALLDRPDASEAERYVDGRLAGQILASLGRLDAAQAELEAARTLARRRFGEGSWRVAEVEVELGALALDRGDLDAADTELSLAEQHYRAIEGAQGIDVARVRFRRAKLDLGRGELSRALGELESLIPAYEQALGPDHRETGEVYNGLGVARFFAGDLPGSVAAYQQALRITARVQGELHQDVGMLYSNLGESLAALGEHEPAGEAYRKALEVLAIAVGPEHPLNALPLKGQAQVLVAGGQAALAIPLLERALRLHGDAAAEPFERADVQRTLALALAATTGDATRIGELAREASATFESLGMPDRARELSALRGPLVHATMTETNDDTTNHEQPRR